jgi:uncharacterized protein YbjT (DUF2867 family)
MKILVTGATGHIGGAAANALRLRGHQVSGFMRPGLVYGNGGSYDIPHLINLARKHVGGSYVPTGGSRSAQLRALFNHLVGAQQE